MPNGDPMTPVQLPEVPEWSGDFMTESEFREAARAYATEAVMAERVRVAALAARWRYLSAKFSAAGDPISIAEAASMLNDAKELEALLGPPSETNSER